MINHDKAQALISARYDELLSPAETRAVQEHLASCAACRQFAAETDILVNGLRTLPQLPPSPRVSRAVRDGIRSGGSPWGWLGHGLRIATSPGLAVASSLVLVAALAFIIVLVVRPMGPEEQQLATISALADVIETPTSTAEPARTPFAAPTMAPTDTAVIPPTQEPTAVPTATQRQTNVAPPTTTSAPTAETASTAAPTQRSIVTRTQSTTVPTVETPPPTTAAPVATQAPTEPPPATEPVSPPIDQSAAGAPITSAQEVATDSGSEPPALPQPTIAPSGPGAEPALDPTAPGDPETAPALEAAAAAESTEPTEASVSTTTNEVAQQPAETVAQPTAPPVAPTSTPVEIMAVESAPPAAAGPAAPAAAPQLEERTGNEAIGMDGDAMVAEIQATVQAGLADDSGPPPVPTSSAPPVTPAPAAAGAAVIAPAGAEITGAPASAPLITEAAPPVTDSAAAPPAADSSAAGAAEISLAPAPTAIVEAIEPAPVAPQVVGAPEPGWPSIGGGGTQLQSNAGYSAITDGGGVSVYGLDGIPLGWVGSGVPIWSPAGTSLLVIGPDGLGAVWDANAGLIPVERPSAAARDIPVGWYGDSPLVQRVYVDGSGLVELRVVPVTGAAGYPIGTATTDSLFGEGVTAARLSPDGGQVSFVAGGQLYIAPVSDPASASPAG